MKKYNSSLISLVGMLLVIGVAINLDNWMDHLKQIAQSEFKVLSNWLLPATIVEFIFVGLLLVWLWYVSNKDSNHLAVNIIFIVVGLGLLFYNYLASVSGLPLPMLLSIYPNSLSSFACAFIAMVGLQGLVFKKTEL
jgi:hypothetical protein